jgi:hypothetical protein
MNVKDRNPGELTARDIQVGRCYEGKRPRRCVRSLLAPHVFNDRQVTWVSPSGMQVQCDSPTVRLGRRYPIVGMTEFLAWVGRDVTDRMPAGDWRPYPGRHPEATAGT